MIAPAAARLLVPLPRLGGQNLPAAALAVLVAVAAPFALAEGPARVVCQAERAGDRARVQISALDLFDRDLLHLVRLGQAGRIELEVVLYRRRRLWFDERRTVETHTTVVSWSRKRQAYLVDGEIGDPARLVFPRLVLGPLEGSGGYVEVAVRLEVVTVGSLVQVARWLVRSEGPPGQSEGPTPSALGRSLLSQVASDLARSANARCPVQ